MFLALSDILLLYLIKLLRKEEKIWKKKGTCLLLFLLIWKKQ